MSALSWLLKAPAATGQWPLSHPLVKLGGQSWTLSDAVQGLLVTGEVGSGKSSAVGDLFARKYLKAGFGGIVLCYNDEEVDAWTKRMKDAGRAGDIRVFGIGKPHRFNFLQYESEQPSAGLDSIDNLVNLLMDILAVRRAALVGNEASFWQPQKKLLTRSCLSLLVMAGEPLTLDGMNALIQSAPSTVEEGESKAWQERSHLYAMLEQVHAKHGDHPEFQAIMTYWLYTRARMPDKTRATIDAEFAGMVDSPLARGALSELFGTTTNLDPTACFDGKVILVAISVEQFREVGQFAALIWTSAFMRAASRRAYKPPHSRPVFLFADESQSFSTENDADFHATCRKKGVCCVRLTQNIPGYVKSFGGGPSAQITVDSILGNLTTKIFLRNSCVTTNSWASKVIAKEIVYRPSMSRAHSGEVSTSMGQGVEDCCPPEEFLKLRNGGFANKRIVDGVLFESGRLFSGSRWARVEFIQP